MRLPTLFTIHYSLFTILHSLFTKIMKGCVIEKWKNKK